MRELETKDNQTMWLDFVRSSSVGGFVVIVQTGTEAFLAWYILCSMSALLFGMRSMITWSFVPICVVIAGIYAIITKRHKYLYPFLIITLIQQAVFMLMAAIILTFSLVSFNIMHQIIGHSLGFDNPPSKMSHWRCMEYYEAEYRSLDDLISQGDFTIQESQFHLSDSSRTRLFNGHFQ
ncbi:hypothetical protein KIN20_019645 [Parelaphostrongylus tenuis]|uniref:Uncharacterized protein n=1 Tax=Parelaphostrongylus tenuis TaxID=148309 RepID=A0AAD5N5P8_PARTN|nr:hypothetical protein KIN20_019645 [Parelaphostrongylus tenuis]